MLISYKYNNFLSFRQEAEFTMLAPSSKVKSRFPNNYVELENSLLSDKNMLSFSLNNDSMMVYGWTLKIINNFMLQGNPLY